ncbi:transposase [Streptosporangium roseum]|uniref:transposase n=1 Tax=Streptosporangium roseum TaxID=2001 RepID=UPI0012DDACD8|nr:transposase [Streptosporangium roseum]
MDGGRLKRHGPTDEKWVRLEPLPPSQNVHGARWNDHRTAINGIFPKSGQPPAFAREA